MFIDSFPYCCGLKMLCEFMREDLYRNSIQRLLDDCLSEDNGIRAVMYTLNSHQILTFANQANISFKDALDKLPGVLLKNYKSINAECDVPDDPRGINCIYIFIYDRSHREKPTPQPMVAPAS